MSFLKDVAYPHVYQDRARTRSLVHILLLFNNSRGENQGKYEVLRTLNTRQKRSPHVVEAQLAEMFAHECFEVLNIRLRMKDTSGSYPSSPPGLHPSRDHVIPDSDFSRVVAAVNARASLSSELKEVLRKLDVQV